MSAWWSDDVAAYLVANGVGTAVGTDVFVGRMPDDHPSTADNMVAIFERPGRGPLVTMTGQGALAEDKTDCPRMQVRVRNTAYDAGRTVAWLVYKLLHGKTNTTLVNGGVSFKLIVAVQEPASLGLDEVQRHEFSQNFDLMIESTMR